MLLLHLHLILCSTDRNEVDVLWLNLKTQISATRKQVYCEIFDMCNMIINNVEC